MLLDVSRHGNRLDVLKLAKTATLAPVEKLRNRVVICDPRILVADRNREKFKEPLGRFRTDIGDNGWHLGLCRSRILKAAEKAGVKLPDNAGRHTFISMHVAHYESIHKTASHVLREFAIHWIISSARRLRTSAWSFLSSSSVHPLLGTSAVSNPS